ncbi:MAG: hypothetical protein ACR2QC_12110 [Gammaproteobacteria bacterium]
MDFIRERGKKSRFFSIFCDFFFGANFAPSARRFRLSPEWRICVLWIFARRRISSAPQFPPLSPSHSCEGRNLRSRKAAGNCTAFGDSLRLRRGDSCLRRNGTGG